MRFSWGSTGISASPPQGEAECVAQKHPRFQYAQKIMVRTALLKLGVKGHEQGDTRMHYHGCYRVGEGLCSVDHSVGPPRGLIFLKQVSLARLCMNLMSSVCPLQCPTHKDAGNFPFIVLWTSSECSAKPSYFGAKDPSSNRAGINRWIAGRANHSASVSKCSQYCSSCWTQCVFLVKLTCQCYFQVHWSSSQCKKFESLRQISAASAS